MWRVSTLPLILFGTGLSTYAQQPFATDDADVTPKGRFHFELSNQFSFLQESAFPNEQQNALVYQLNYGLREGLEFSIDSPYLVIVNGRGTVPRVAAGVGDTNLAVKWNFRRERETSRWPALTIAYAVEMPTGDPSTQLGSGVYDFRLIAIGQKTLSPKMKLRVNQGILFSGNTLTGVVGLQTLGGLTYLAAASLVQQFTSRLSLGVEFSCARTLSDSGMASRAALQQQVGGKYQIRENLTIDFGVAVGQLGESPRLGLQIGLSMP